jgi:hypothetical protein
MAYEIIHVHPKSSSCPLMPKIQICCFQIGEYATDEIWLIACPTSWKNIEHETSLCGEERRDHSCLAPTACHVLGITYAAERADIFEDAVMC